MNCPKCDYKTQVFDSRPGPQKSVWRRRRCLRPMCDHEVSTYERIAEDDSASIFKSELNVAKRKLGKLQKAQTLLAELQAI